MGLLACEGLDPLVWRRKAGGDGGSAWNLHVVLFTSSWEMSVFPPWQPGLLVSAPAVRHRLSSLLTPAPAFGPRLPEVPVLVGSRWDGGASYFLWVSDVWRVSSSDTAWGRSVYVLVSLLMGISSLETSEYERGTCLTSLQLFRTHILRPQLYTSNHDTRNTPGAPTSAERME